MSDLETNNKITMYAHPACPMMYPVKALFDNTSVNYEYINIHEDDTARQYVREVNNGYESVPTLLFPDGSTMTEPGMNDLKQVLNTMGYDVPVQAWLLANAPRLLFYAVILWAILRFLEIL
ncbi:MAG: glutaredoxin domain-containing protein [Aggregatilineales bacterium]